MLYSRGFLFAIPPSLNTTLPKPQNTVGFYLECTFATMADKNLYIIAGCNGAGNIRGIKNLLDFYIDIVDAALIFDNSFGKHQLIAQTDNKILEVIDELKFSNLKAFYDNI